MNTENHYQETDLGNISIHLCGEYDPQRAYEYLDAVEFGGGSYICAIEYGKTITGIAPEPTKNTEYWHINSIPGTLTPEYIAIHDRVVNLSERVEADAEEVRTAEHNVSGMELNVTQMQEQTRQAAEAAEQSKDSAAGYAASADTSRQAAEESEQNINAQITGFDVHVAEKTEEAENDIEAARIAANKAIIAQQEQSVNEVARVGIEAISTAQEAAQTATEKAQAAATSEKNAEASEKTAKLSETNAMKMAEQVAADKEQVANDRTAVEKAKQEMTESVAQIEQNTQGISELKSDFVELEDDLYSKSDNIYDENQEFLQDKYIPYWDSPNIDVLGDEAGKYTTQIIPCDAIPYCCINVTGNITTVADTFAYYDSNGNYLGKGSNGIIPKNDNTASIRITFNSEARKNILKAIVPYVDGKTSGYEVNPYGNERKFVVKEELTPLATKEELTQATSAISILSIQNDVDCHFREMKKNIATWKNLILKDGKEDSEYYPEFEKGVICIQADDGNADIKAFSDLCNEYGFTLDLALPLEKLDNSCDGRTIKDVALEMQSNGSEILVHHTDVLTSEYKGNPQMLFEFFGKRKFDMQKEGFNLRGIILSGGAGYNTADFAEAVKWCNHYYEYSDMYGSGQKFPMYRMGRLTCLGTDNLESLKTSITNKINKKTFAIIYTHGISATGTDSYQTNESTMRSLLSWLKETYIDTGLAENLSMGEMVDKYGISLLQRKLSN